MRKFEAKYPGVCRRCDTRFEVGTEICYADRHLGYVHADVTCLLAPPEAEPKPTDVSGILALLRAAGEHLRYPRIRLQTPGGQPVSLRIAGPRSKIPGAVTVTDGRRNGDWFGRILPEGIWQGRAPAEVIELVTRMAEAPAKTAAEYGHLTGSCCFCSRALSDERSTSVGYGPICAGHYGLPWGA